MKKVVILGGGFGGISAALELSRGLPDEAEITLVERSPAFMMGLRNLWIVTGRGTRRDGERPIAALRAGGVDIRQGTVQAIDAPGRTVRTDGGVLPFDYLIVALGAEVRPDLVSGFSEAAYNLYSADDAERLGRRIRDFRSGRIAISIMGVPYKCPPAPYEAAMLLDDVFRRLGTRQNISIQTFTPQPMSLPVVGAANCAHVEGLLAAKGIGFAPNRKVARVDGSALVFEDGARVDADLLIGVPPHRPPAVVRESGLAMRGEWLQVDPETLRTSADGVFAVGDVNEIPLANKLALPKAGLFAESQGKVAARAIIAEVKRASSSDAFDGHGYCFIETGAGLATMVQGNFFASPAPALTIAPPSAQALQQKLEFEQSRLGLWFQ